VLAAGSAEVIARKAIQVKRLNRALEMVNLVMVRIKFRRILADIIASITIFRNRRVSKRRQATSLAIIVGVYQLGGRERIRTSGRLTPTPDFESGAFNHSATLPVVD
jgi:hypothetical protein